MTAWILVGDASRAKLLSAELREDEWSQIEAFDHPEGREPGHEIGMQAPAGRTIKSKEKGARHTALEPHTSPREAEAERFARQLGKYLEDAVARRRFDFLVLVPPPRFLGQLQKALGRQAAKLVRQVIDKDLSTLEPRELRDRLVDEVFPTHARSA